MTCRRGGLYNDFTVRRLLAFFILCALPAGLAAAVLRATVAAPIRPVTAEDIGQVLARADAEGAALELRPTLGVILPVAVGVSLVLAFLVALVVRAQARRPATGAEGLIGETGAARTDLVPGGKVFVHGELWDAEADGAVRQGEKIKVVRVLEGLRLRVTKVREGGGS